MRKRVLLIVGHNEKSQGCLCPYAEKEFNTEWKYCKKLVEILSGLTSYVKYDIFVRHKNSGGYKAEMKDVIDRAKQHQQSNGFVYDLALEIHLNSMPEDSPNGSETIYYKNNKKGKEFSDILKKNLNERHEIKIREGYAVLNPDDHNGARGVCTSPWTYVLIEPFFASNKSNAEKFKTKEQMEELAYILNMSVEKLLLGSVVTNKNDVSKEELEDVDTLALSAVDRIYDYLKKGNKLDDLRQAIEYLNKAIELKEKTR